MAMAMQRYDVGHIIQWSTSGALLEASGCRHRASAAKEFVETTQNTNKTQLLATINSGA
jgi:hypothetical protein